MKRFLKSLSLGLVVAFVGVIMCACVPSNTEKAKAKMEEAGYAVVAYEKADEEGLIGGISATKVSLTDGSGHITALLFDSNGSAKDYYEKHVNNENVVQKGKWVYWGSENAIEVFES